MNSERCIMVLSYKAAKGYMIQAVMYVKNYQIGELFCIGCFTAYYFSL